jgi:hypothetical protein
LGKGKTKPTNSFTLENEKEKRAREYREKAANLGSEELKSEERFVIKIKNNFVLGNEKEEKTREYKEKTSEYEEKSREKSQLPAI